MTKKQELEQTIKALKKLPAEQYQAISLLCFCDLREREAAQLMGVTRHKLRRLEACALENLKLNCRLLAVDSAIDKFKKAIRSVA